MTKDSESVGKIQCAYAECTNLFQPRNKDHRCCSTRCQKKHRYALLNPTIEVSVDTPQAALTDEQLIALAQSRGIKLYKENPVEPRVRLAPKKTTRYRLGVISDTHLGSQFQQLTYMNEFCEEFKKESCDAILHAGDLVHGTHKMHRGMEYELHVLGADAQVRYAVDNFPDTGIPVYMISGNHDLSFEKDAGVDVVSNFADQRDDVTYLGQEGAFFEIGGALVYLWHGGNGAHAKSWNIQKWAEGVSPEQKPHVMLDGHLHYACHVPAHRNIELFQLPCTQAQTPFEKRKKLHPVIGALILDLWVSPNGVEDLQTKWMIRRIPVPSDF